MSAAFLLSLLVRLTVVLAWPKFPNCPVSSLIQPEIDHLAPYPIFYEPSIFPASEEANDTSLVPKTSATCNCRIFADQEQEWRGKESLWATRVNEKHQDGLPGACANSFCPVEDVNIAHAFETTHWPYKAHALCALKSAKNKMHSRKLTTVTRKKKVVNVIAFGGSMTHGGYLTGETCFDLKYEASLKRPFASFGLHYDPKLIYCTWFGRLMQWMNLEFSEAVDLRFYNLAEGGTNSDVMSGMVSTRLRKEKIVLSSNDIVFLDHSCNDYSITGTSGIEKLVRSIYRECSSLNDRPTMIMMEQLSRLGGPPSYLIPYRRVAEYYSLPLFSYADTIRQPTSGEKNLYGLIGTYMLHAPWHAHMYLADVLSRYLVELMDTACQGLPSSMINQEHTGSRVMNYSEYLASIDTLSGTKSGVYGIGIEHAGDNGFGRHRLIMPEEPLSKELVKGESVTCSAHTPFTMMVEAENNFTPPNVTEFEAGLTEWTEYADHHSVAGWIMVATEGGGRGGGVVDLDLVFPLKNKICHINEYANGSSCISSNTGRGRGRGSYISVHTAAAAAAAAAEYPRVGLRIQHLITYKDAGTANVFLCGADIGSIDTLIKQRISITHMFDYELLKTDIERCNSLSADGSQRNITITHNGLLDPDTRAASIAGNHKVKIMHMHMCTLSNNA
jgi:hypothetical protein